MIYIVIIIAIIALFIFDLKKIEALNDERSKELDNLDELMPFV